ncbi:serine/threonine-protein kinase [Nocardiopsis sp. RSe5-2]|uniref:Serine/threonine-protein kinase n=1 Tax=Nocardiopsis endophytica TaxID=3018445 RepID=A0ABT4TWT4_9ACTN|nr:serine/threonine-protein kinase [Nocardiopsis endophytica]MDA2809158.1 serine/threonine-protein kinase [Nocardiopsis endophytica]
MTTPGMPERIGPYRITQQIGRGGQGTVYLGTGPDGVEVAVKVLSGDWEGNELQRARFARELESVRRVAPFCTAAVVEADVEGDPPFIASEFVRGPTLRAAVHKEGPRTGAALDRLAVATATALVAVHSAGVVHRDFKPANVLLGPDGPRVIDFGIARTGDATLTQTGTVTGTPAYMAPEQIRGARVGPEADVFAWAAVIAFAASGRGPFDGDSVHEVLHKVVSDEPNLEEVPERLRPLLRACLDKDPARRPTAVRVLGALVGRDPGPEAEASPDTVTEVLREGASAAAGRTMVVTVPLAPAPTVPVPTAPAPAPPTGPTRPAEAPRNRRRRRKRPSGALLLALLAVLLAGGAAWLLADGIPRPGWLTLPDAVPARQTAPADQDTGRDTGEAPEVSGEGGAPVGGGGEPEGTTGRTPVETSQAPPEYTPEETPDTHTEEPETTGEETEPPTTTETQPSPEPSGTGDASPAGGEVPTEAWPSEEGTA